MRQLMSKILYFVSWGILVRMEMAQNSLVSQTAKVQYPDLPWKHTFHTSLVKSLLSKRKNVGKDEINRVKALNAIYPTADSTSTWVNAYSYSTNDCGTGSEVTINALVSGVCFNYEGDIGLNSLKLTCTSSSSKCTLVPINFADLIPLNSRSGSKFL
jgi:hypothetical protein